MAVLNKLNPTKIAKLKPSDCEQNVGDGGGLWLRVQPQSKGGAKSFYFRYSFGGKAKKISLGTFPGTSLADARGRRIEAVEALEAGRDPAFFIGVGAGAMTVRQLAELWKSTVLSTHADRGEKIFRALEFDLLKKCGGQAAATVTHDQIVSVLDEMVSRGAKAKASKMLAWMRQMFAFAIRRRIITADPVAGLKARDVGASEGTRERNLSFDEIAELAEKTPGAGLPLRTEAAMWILLATGVRTIELRTAKVVDVHIESGIWYIPETKNGRAHVVHISDFAAQWFDVLLNNADAEYLLPGRHPKRPIGDELLRKTIGERISTVKRKKGTQYAGTLLLSGGKWSLHDLRRTMASRMGDLGVEPHVIEACLNHVKGGIEGVYQRQQYLSERKAAFEVWGQKLTDLISRA